MRFVALVLSVVSPLVIADQEAFEKYYGYLPEEVLSLSAEERRSELPMVFGVNEKDIEALKHTVPLWLSELHYPTAFEDTSAAIKMFQKDLGDEPTGNLSVGQLYMLNKRREFFELSGAEVAPLESPGAGEIFESSYYGKYATLSGQWEIVGDSIAEPINSVKVQCREKQRTCSIQEIKVDDESSYENFLDSWGGTVYVISDDYEISILDWSGSVVIAKPDSDEGCRTTIWTLDFELEEFSQVTRNSGDPEACADWHLDSPRVAKIIVDSSEVYRVRAERNRTRRESGFSVTYSGFQAKRQAAINELTKIYE